MQRILPFEESFSGGKICPVLHIKDLPAILIDGDVPICGPPVRLRISLLADDIYALPPSRKEDRVKLSIGKNFVRN